MASQPGVEIKRKEKQEAWHHGESITVALDLLSSGGFFMEKSIKYIYEI